jgi:hypothetical protein
MQKDFLYITASRPTLVPNQSAIKWAQWVPSPEVNQEGLETEHAPPSSAEVKDGGATTLARHTPS